MNLKFIDLFCAKRIKRFSDKKDTAGLSIIIEGSGYGNSTIPR